MKDGLYPSPRKLHYVICREAGPGQGMDKAIQQRWLISLMLPVASRLHFNFLAALAPCCASPTWSVHHRDSPASWALHVRPQSEAEAQPMGISNRRGQSRAASGRIIQDFCIWVLHSRRASARLPWRHAAAGGRTATSLCRAPCRCISNPPGSKARPTKYSRAPRLLNSMCVKSLAWGRATHQALLFSGLKKWISCFKCEIWQTPASTMPQLLP